MTTLDTRDNFPIKLNGVHYEIDLRSYRRNTIEATRAQQDQSSESSEQTLNNQYLWKRSGEDFGFGSNQKWFDADQNDSRKRFADSLNVNVWDDREVKLLNKLTNSLSAPTYASGTRSGQRMQLPGSWVFSLRNTLFVARNFVNTATPFFPKSFTVAAVTDPDADSYSTTTILQDGGTYGSFAPPVEAFIISLIQDGESIYASFSGYNKIWKIEYDGSSVTATGLGGAYDYRDIFSVAEQIFATRSDSTTTYLVRVTASSDVVVDEWPLAQAPKITGAISGPDGIYWSGILSVLNSLTSFTNSKSQIFRSTFDETTAEWNSLSAITSLPEGEVITALSEYSGYLLIGTSNGFRLGQFTQTGGVNYGPLNAFTPFASFGTPAGARPYEGLTKRINRGVTKFEGEGNFVWFNYSGYKPTLNAFNNKIYFGVGRIDLGQLVNDLQPAWSTDLMQYDTFFNDNVGNNGSFVQSFHIYSGRIIFSTNLSGVFAQKASVYADEGYLNTGKINFGTAELKRFARAEIKAQVSNSSADKISYTVIAEDAGSTNQTGIYGDGQTARTIYLTDSYGEYAQIEFKLQSGSSGSLTPVLNRWTLRALPLPERQEEIFLPIILKDNVAHNLSSVTGLNPYDEFQTLRALLQSRVVVPLTMGDETVDVIVDSIITGQDQGARMDRWNHDESWAEGVWYVKCITISTTGVTATPVVVNNLVGPQGAAGPKGDTGLKGDTGAKGDTGDTGSAGAAGISTALTIPIGKWGRYPAPMALRTDIYDGYVMAHPFVVTTTSTYDRIAVRTGSVTSSGSARLGIYNSNGCEPTTRVIDAGSISFSTANTNYAITINVTLSPGVYWLAMNIASGFASWQGYASTSDQGMFQLMQSESTTGILTSAFANAVGIPSTLSGVGYDTIGAAAVFVRRSA
jgi:hypothetical protein